MPHRPNTYQFNLFSNPRDARVEQTPQWQALPTETRQTLTKLMVRLILDHIDGDEPSSRSAQAWRRLVGRPCLLPALRTQIDGPLYRNQTQFVAVIRLLRQQAFDQAEKLREARR